MPKTIADWAGFVVVIGLLIYVIWMISSLYVYEKRIDRKMSEDNYKGVDATIKIEFDEHGPCLIETTTEAADAAGATE